MTTPTRAADLSTAHEIVRGVPDYQMRDGLAIEIAAALTAAHAQGRAEGAAVVNSNEQFDNLATHVAQISLSVDYLYDSMNILSHQCNGLHERITKLEAAAVDAAKERGE